MMHYKATHAPAQPFSQQLETWLRQSGAKTVGSLQHIVAEKSFAIIFLVLMALPALPLPTGGATHVFEVVVILLAAQMIIGRRSLWLPKKLLDRPLGSGMLHKGIPALIRVVRWFERRSKRRAGVLMVHPRFQQLLGLVVLGFTVAALLSVPFSGLDTLPALGVVVISLSIILEDGVLAIIGVIIGCAGILLSLTLGAAIATFLRTIL
jgi:hypothetical protein